MLKHLSFKPFVDTQSKKNNISFVFSDDFIVPIKSSLLDTRHSSDHFREQLNKMGLLYCEDSLINVSLFSNSPTINKSLSHFIEVENESNALFRFMGPGENSELVIFIPDVLFSESTFEEVRDLLLKKKKILLLDFTRKEVFLGPFFSGSEDDISYFESYRDRRYLNSINATLVDSSYVSKSKHSRSSIESALNILRSKTQNINCFEKINHSTLFYVNHANYSEKIIQIPSLINHNLSLDTFEVKGETIVDNGSGLRVKDVEEVASILKNYVCPVLGILSKIISYKNNFDFSSVGVTSVEKLSRGTIASHYGSAGKGISSQHSLVSTIAEAIERSTLVLSFDINRCLYGRLSEIQKKHKTISPAKIEEVHLWQRKQKECLNRNIDVYNLPLEYNDEPIHWISSFSLITKEKVLIPAKTCFSSNQLPFNHYFVESTSNGLAAGATIEEAIIQGSLEIIERDAFAIWWFNELSLNQIIGLAGKSNYLRGLLDHLESEDIFVQFLYFKTDFDVHNIFAIGFNSNGSNGLIGMGTHFDVIIAAERAIGELAQSRPNRERETNYCHFSFLNKFDFPFLVAKSEVHIDDILDLKKHFINTKMAIEYLISEFENNKLDLLFTDVSNKLFDLKVVRVISPGTAKHYQRFNCKRLYTVPNKLGFTKCVTDPAKFNTLSYINWKVLFYGS
jgi:thiazole/oxazole-forming peptide maturase SagD family component